MTIPTYCGYHFPCDVIQRAVWTYLRFTLSYRDVEDLLAERGIEVSYETVRRWVFTFGPAIARRLRRRFPFAKRIVGPRTQSMRSPKRIVSLALLAALVPMILPPFV